MKINPIIPIWLMAIICVGLLLLKKRNIWAYIRQILIVVLLFVINLRIMLPGEVESVADQEMDAYVLFVVDDTISMLADDYTDGRQRLEGVQEAVVHMVDELSGAKFSVVSFHNTANLLSPFTDNGEHIKNVIDALYPISDLYAHGTSLNTAHEATRETIKQVYDKNDGRIYLFFISDGEITDDSQLESFGDIASMINGGAVLGYGTTEGGQMTMKYYYSDEEETIMDYSSYPSGPAISRIDETNLNQLSRDLGIDYIHVNAPSDLDEKIQIIEEMSTTTFVENDETRKRVVEGMNDIYFYFVIPLLLLLLWEGIAIIRKK